MKPITETHAGFAVIQHHTAGKSVTGGARELAQSTKVGLGHRCCRLDLHSGDGSGAKLDEDVHFDAILAPEMEKRCPRVVPARLSPQLLERERFQKLSQQGSISLDRLSIRAEQCCGKAGIGHMQLRSLDQATQTIAMPGRESLQQE